MGSEGLTHDPDAAAVGATGRITRVLDTGRCPHRRGGDRTGRAPVSGPVAPMTGGRAAPAVRSDVDASVRQDVRKKPTHTRVGREGTDVGWISGRCLVLKRDVAILPLEAALMAAGHSQARRGKIADGWLATADWRTGHDPVLCPDVRIDVSAPGGFVQVV